MLTFPHQCRAHHSRGVTLVELMIAMVLGLIVTGAVIALVVAIIKSNRQTLQSTRLTQELRATLSVIANDMRRARSVDDPLSTALDPAGNPFGAVSTAQAACAIYAYDGAVNGPWHVVRLDAGRIVLHGSATRPVNCAIVGTPFVLGSDQVEITALSFTPTTTATNPPLASNESIVREFTVTIAGRLVDTDSELSGITRTMSQTVYVRAVGAGT